MILRSIVFAVFLIGTHSVIFGQKLTGTILNGSFKPIAGVHILNLSNDLHTHSDEQGNFQFATINGKDTLQLTHVGYNLETYIVKSLDSPLKIFLESKTVTLDEVIIGSKVNALRVISDIDTQIDPVSSSQDILKKVPGLFIGQHAGGGKAEQIFLRGFDIDHGTDINITVDGLPVNIVSHAHGQGYSDLHFIIPETIDKIDLGKGPYYANKGNFNTAGYINFLRKSELESNLIKLETGQFNTHRLLGMFNLFNTGKQNSYIATEYMAMDGPFDSPQNFSRSNLFWKYSNNISKTDKLELSISNFRSKWDASGQIPQRAVDQNLITRFGAIDDTEGGNTGRTNIIVNYNKFITENSSIQNTAYFSKYDFTLFSNFTFFLEDPINGDQIKQHEDRTLWGLNSEYKSFFSLNNISGHWNAGISLRNDFSRDNQLAFTLNRKETLNLLQLGDIDETNFGAFVGAKIELGKWTFNPAVRMDYFHFQYQDALQTLYSTQTNNKSIFSPKLTVLYNLTNDFQLYSKLGKGFHTNDTRVVIANSSDQILPAAYGLDIGYLWKATPNLLINMAYWYLFLEQEFVYVGDAGVVEPSGETVRQGIDLSVRYQPTSWLYWNFDAHYTSPKAIEQESGEDHIPLAADLTLLSGINFKHKSGLYGGLSLRHLGDRPANEDYSITAEGYTIVDLNTGYKWKNIDLGFQVQNLLNSEWNETQFATESRLSNESNSIEEIHFTPGTPFFIKGIISFSF